MANFLVLFICFSAGALARRRKTFSPETPRVLNAWILWVAFPALVVRSVHRVHLSFELIAPVVGLWVVAAIPFGMALIAVKRGFVSRGAAGALALCAGLGNTAFVGLPVIEALLGHEALGPAAVIDQLGSFVALSLLAVPLAMYLSGQGVAHHQIIGRILRFPPFSALVVGLLLRPIAFADVVETALARIGDTLSPLALASVGWQLNVKQLRSHAGALSAGLAYKLLLAPAIVLGLASLFSSQLTLATRAGVLEAAMPPMVTAGVLVAEYELDAELASTMIAVGLVVSCLTIPAWWWLLSVMT